MSEILTNPGFGNVLSVVDLAGIVLVYASLSRRITKLERVYGKPSSSAIISSSSVEHDPSYLELVARIDQLETEREIMIKKLQEHQILLTQIVHEFRARAASSQVKTLAPSSDVATGAGAEHSRRQLSVGRTLKRTPPLAPIPSSDDEDSDEDVDREAKEFLLSKH
jgi:hypothetical protein